MKTNSQFDYIIVGCGLAGLHLGYRFSKDVFFKNHSFLIIEKNKFMRENFFSFWEIGEGEWDSIIKKKWVKGEFHSSREKLEMDFSEYNYKTLNSLDFSKFVNNKLKNEKNFSFVNDTILKIKVENNEVIAVGNKKNYFAKHIFDSRISKVTLEKLSNYTSLKQHFLGWVIKTNENKFDKNSFIFMDYRVRDKNSTAFTYLLPYKKNEALVEYTYFSKEACNMNIYESFLKKYLNKYFHTSEYKIIKTEAGIIPMTTYPFHMDSCKNITKIGTAGGWVKPSTGYSFKNCEKYSIKILDNIKKGRQLRIIPNKKYNFLDKLLLGVLSRYNQRGETIFYKMIKRNYTKNILRFLDEKSTLLEIIKIIISVRSIYFVKIFIKNLYKKNL